jgi:hypothetical protein
MIRLRVVPSAVMAVATASRAPNKLAAISIKGMATSTPPTTSDNGNGNDHEEAAVSQDIYEVTRDEDRGIFRILDIGKAKPFSPDWAKRGPRQGRRAISRCECPFAMPVIA